MNKNAVIHEYIRKRIAGRDEKIGVIVGFIGKDGFLAVGWSQTNLKAGDVFSKVQGMNLATDRANGSVEVPEMPSQLMGQMGEFQIRCLRYFQQAIFQLDAVSPTKAPNPIRSGRNWGNAWEEFCKLNGKDLGMGREANEAIAIPVDLENFARLIETLLGRIPAN